MAKYNLKYSNKFKKGDVIRSYDFIPMPGREPSYIEGKVLDPDFEIRGAAVYKIKITKDTHGTRVGDTGFCPHEVSLTEWNGRLQLAKEPVIKSAKYESVQRYVDVINEAAGKKGIKKLSSKTSPANDPAPSGDVKEENIDEMGGIMSKKEVKGKVDKGMKELDDLKKMFNKKKKKDVKEDVLTESQMTRWIDLLGTAISKHNTQPEFNKAAQAMEDWGNKFPRSVSGMKGMSAYMWDVLIESLDVRLGMTEEKKIEDKGKEDDGEGMDKVGQEDSDVDNDGDSDKSDEYLNNRRKAISKKLADKANK